MNTVSINLAHCDSTELAILRDIFRKREAQCLHLTGAVPVEYLRGLEAEAEVYAGEVRKIKAEIARQTEVVASHRAHHEKMIAQRRIRDARVLRPAGRW